MPLVIVFYVEHGNDETNNKRLVVTTTAESVDDGACQHEIIFYEILKTEIPKIAERVKQLSDIADEFVHEINKGMH
jgi:hypothetical protein